MFNVGDRVRIVDSPYQTCDDSEPLKNGGTGTVKTKIYDKAVLLDVDGMHDIGGWHFDVENLEPLTESITVYDVHVTTLEGNRTLVAVCPTEHLGEMVKVGLQHAYPATAKDTTVTEREIKR